MVGSNRLLRGGSWNNNAQNCRSAYRNRDDPGNRDNNVGFRLVFVPQLTGMVGGLPLNRWMSRSHTVRQTGGRMHRAGRVNGYSR
ncbi:SUMF1/EgtB/PvdO family nonheme iron enzyme [candidate division KSB1 bacterium]|nr:SUMF1/EgtB/PvdO family nonheme iron enzyme [candidate division KSB1 bacterium]